MWAFWDMKRPNRYINTFVTNSASVTACVFLSRCLTSNPKIWERGWADVCIVTLKREGGTSRKIPKKHAFPQSVKMSLCINLESWNFLCLLLLTLSSGKKSQIWISRSYDLQFVSWIWNFRYFAQTKYPSFPIFQGEDNNLFKKTRQISSHFP